jgi:hypothetical protein
MFGIKEFVEAIKDLPEDVRENLEEMSKSGVFGRIAKNIGRNFAEGVLETSEVYRVSVERKDWMKYPRKD